MAEHLLAPLLEVEKTSRGSFEGWCLTGAHGRIFGGQVAAQALRAAALSVPRDRDAHSLQSCFVRPGDPALPVGYSVTTVREGRTLSTCRVDAHQASRVIFTGLVSFHLPEPGADYQDDAPEAAGPEELVESAYVPPGTNGDVRAPIEFRYVDPVATSEVPAPAEQLTWLRSRTALGEESSVHAAALTFASDLTLTRTAHMPLRRPGITRIGASLDHTMWFHRRFRADAWLLFAQRSTSYAGSRALSHGMFFDRDGVLVASASQEALIRLGT
ncbi:MAG: putative acyl-CoA thioesterase [Blastococcus sp.]|jgi:acyl-CoA thioesterase-2|nr:putative acyl-CoA thioesterase [Blastococcus sp.]